MSKEKKTNNSLLMRSNVQITVTESRHVSCNQTRTSKILHLIFLWIPPRDHVTTWETHIKPNVCLLCKETKSLLRKHEETGINTKKSDVTGNIKTFIQYFPALKVKLIRDWTGRTSGLMWVIDPAEGRPVYFFQTMCCWALWAKPQFPHKHLSPWLQDRSEPKGCFVVGPQSLHLGKRGTELSSDHYLMLSWIRWWGGCWTNQAHPNGKYWLCLTDGPIHEIFNSHLQQNSSSILRLGRLSLNGRCSTPFMAETAL